MGFRNVYALLFQPVYDLVKSCYLKPGEKDILLVQTVSRTKVRVNTVYGKIFLRKNAYQVLHFFSGSSVQSNPESQPVHSCVQFDMHLDPMSLRVQRTGITVINQRLGKVIFTKLPCPLRRCISQYQNLAANAISAQRNASSTVAAANARTPILSKCAAISYIPCP